MLLHMIGIIQVMLFIEKIRTFIVNNKQYYSIYNSVHTCYHNEEYEGY